MRNKGMLLTAMAMMMALGQTEGPIVSTRRSHTKKAPNKAPNKAKLAEAAGLKKFVIEGREIWALNEKNAIRKFNKQKP